jgi:hypothetical protein
MTNSVISKHYLPRNLAARLWRINDEVIPMAYETFDRVEVSPS